MHSRAPFSASLSKLIRPSVCRYFSTTAKWNKRDPKLYSVYLVTDDKYLDNNFDSKIISALQSGVTCVQLRLKTPRSTSHYIEKAMEIENNSQYGNAAAVFTTSGEIAKIVSDSASSGMIGINIGVPVPRDPFSFGGWNESKYGHGDITGKSGVQFWTNLKKVTARWPETEEPWKKYF